MFNFFKETVSKAAPKTLEPIKRLTNGWVEMGAVHRKPDTRTSEELTKTIDYYVSQIPELKDFTGEIKKMNSKHMGLIADTLELSQSHSMLSPLEAQLDNVFSKVAKEKLVPQMIKASKENPESMELVEAIINNTDVKTSKYALYRLSSGVLNMKEYANLMTESAKKAPKVADETLGGSYTMDFTKQDNFVEKLFGQ